MTFEEIEGYYRAPGVVLLYGDCIEVMRTLPDASVDAIVTDPPYELGFMGKGWDASGIANSVELWTEARRLLKPGGHLAAFGGTRTYHRMACAIEDAGFEVRDSLLWLYGSGFPKSMDVSKAIDRAAGAVREVVGLHPSPQSTRDHLALGEGWQEAPVLTAPATDAAREWEGWGTALKPAYEPIVLARKPFPGTVAANVLEHGTGALNINGTRIEASTRPAREPQHGEDYEGWGGIGGSRAIAPTDVGRWPANVIVDEEAARLIDAATGELVSGDLLPGHKRGSGETSYGGGGGVIAARYGGDRGGASRFFKGVKWTSEDVNAAELASSLPSEPADSAQNDAPTPREIEQSDRGQGSIAASESSTPIPSPALSAEPPDGTDTTPTTPSSTASSGSAADATGAPINSASEARAAGGRGRAPETRFWYTSKASRGEREAGVEVEAIRRTDGRESEHQTGHLRTNERRNDHPTVKPVDLMRWLCRLVTPPGGVVLDCFNGSGTTGMAALDEGFRYIGIEREERYLEIAVDRITHRHLLEVETKPPEPERPQGRLL